MTENKGDLISREVLKKEVENLVVGGAEGLKNYYENGSKSDENAWIGGIYDAWELINNATTVHHPNCDNCEDKAKQYSLGFQDGYLLGGFQLAELRRWLIAQGYSEETVNDKIEDFGKFVKRVRKEE